MLKVVLSYFRIHTIVLLIESLLFGLFSIAVLTDQVSETQVNKLISEYILIYGNITNCTISLLKFNY